MPPTKDDRKGRPYYTTDRLAKPRIVGADPRDVNFRAAVILSAAKDLRSAWREILRCAQDDSRRVALAP